MLQVRRHCLYHTHSKIAHCSFYDFSQIYVMDCLSQCLFLDSFIALTPQRILRRLPSNLSGHQIRQMQENDRSLQKAPKLQTQIGALDIGNFLELCKRGLILLVLLTIKYVGIGWLQNTKLSIWFYYIV